MEGNKICKECKRSVDYLVTKTRSGEILDLCRGCYSVRNYNRRTGNEPFKYRKTGIKCDHPSKKPGHTACSSCYCDYWRENSSTICECGRETKRSITPVCPDCRAKKQKGRTKNITEENYNSMRMFLIKSRLNLLGRLDTLKMIDLYLNMNLNEVTLAYWTNPIDCHRYLLKTFKSLVEGIQSIPI